MMNGNGSNGNGGMNNELTPEQYLESQEWRKLLQKQKKPEPPAIVAKILRSDIKEENVNNEPVGEKVPAGVVRNRVRRPDNDWDTDVWADNW